MCCYSRKRNEYISKYYSSGVWCCFKRESIRDINTCLRFLNVHPCFVHSFYFVFLRYEMNNKSSNCGSLLLRRLRLSHIYFIRLVLDQNSEFDREKRKELQNSQVLPQAEIINSALFHLFTLSDVIHAFKFCFITTARPTTITTNSSSV